MPVARVRYGEELCQQLVRSERNGGVNLFGGSVCVQNGGRTDTNLIINVLPFFIQ